MTDQIFNPQGALIMTRKYEDIPTAQLVTFHANARHTGCTAGGHGKGNRNQALANEYAEELSRRGVTVEITGEGIFNGPGST